VIKPGSILTNKEVSMKKQLYRAAAATVLGLSLTTGIVAADTGNIDTTGPNSNNSIRSHVTNRNTVRNTNDIDVNNSNHQTARTGYASVRGNTFGGDATTGSASNDNSTSADISVDNSSSSSNNWGAGSWGGGFGGDASISDTGPNSRNTIDSRVSNTSTVTNNNDIDVRNTNNQTATSGNATVSGNTHGGDATSGDASNYNSSSFTISVQN